MKRGSIFLFWMAALVLLVALDVYGAEVRLYTTGSGLVGFLKTETAVPQDVLVEPITGYYNTHPTATWNVFDSWGIMAWDAPAPYYTATVFAPGEQDEWKNGITWGGGTMSTDYVNLSMLSGAKVMPFVYYSQSKSIVQLFFNATLTRVYLNNNALENTPDGNFALTTTDVAPMLSPIVQGQPKSITIDDGQMAELTVEAVSVTPMSPTYQWLKNGQPITGATDNQIQVDQAGEYACQISDVVGTKVSNTATVTVNGQPPQETEATLEVVNGGVQVTLTTDNVEQVFPDLDGSIIAFGAVFRTWNDADGQFTEVFSTKTVDGALPLKAKINPPRNFAQQMRLVAITATGAHLAVMDQVHGRVIGNSAFNIADINPIPVGADGYWEFNLSATGLPIGGPLAITIIGVTIAIMGWWQLRRKHA